MVRLSSDEHGIRGDRELHLEHGRRLEGHAEGPLGAGALSQYAAIQLKWRWLREHHGKHSAAYPHQDELIMADTRLPGGPMIPGKDSPPIAK